MTDRIQTEGAPKARAEYPLLIEPVAALDYFEKREKFNLFRMILSPSFLTVAVPIVLLYFLPKLTNAMMGMLLRPRLLFWH